MRTALGRLLSLADYQVAAFGSGETFLASLALRTPACVILDVHMPGLTGFAVQSRLSEANIGLPVVFITASEDPALEQAVLEAKGVALLRKPFTNDQLLNAVSAALRTRPSAAS